MLLAEQFTDPAIERVFADEQFLAQLLRVETELAQARLGVIPVTAAQAKRLSFALSSMMSRTEAKKLLKEASQDAAQQGRRLVDVLRERVSATLDWNGLRSEATYLGATQAWIDRALTAGATILRDVAYVRDGHPRHPFVF